MATSDSNAKRLAALKNRKQQQCQQAQVIQKSLKDGALPNKVTKFSDSEEEEPMVTDILHDIESDGDEVVFADKQHFHGKRGEKLMGLQSKIGSDDRFQLDTRFESSDSESEAAEEDPEVVQLKEERNTQYLIMDSILGQLGLNTRKPHPSTNKTIEEFVRYDPTDAAHSKYVVTRQKREESAEPEPLESAHKEDEVEKTVSDAPVVDKSTYFEVKTNFTPSESTGSGFTFGFSFEEPSRETEGQIESAQVVGLQQDSSDEEEQIELPTSAPKTAPARSFFFYTQNPEFKDLSLCSFGRTKTMEEIEADLVAQRPSLTIEYRKRHKDAIRMQRKLSSK